MCVWRHRKSSEAKGLAMNIYEDEGLEQKLEELTDLAGQLILDILLVSLRKVVREHQAFRELAEDKWPVAQKPDSF
jgi:hypothetical protein